MIGLDEFWWADDQVQWFFHKGCLLFPAQDRETTATYRFCVTVEADEFNQMQMILDTNPSNKDGIFYPITFVASNADTPPARFTDIRNDLHHIGRKFTTSTGAKKRLGDGTLMVRQSKTRQSCDVILRGSRPP